MIGKYLIDVQSKSIKQIYSEFSEKQEEEDSCGVQNVVEFDFNLVSLKIGIDAS